MAKKELDLEDDAEAARKSESPGLDPNPYWEPIRSSTRRLRSIRIQPPWIPHVIQAVILAAVVVLLWVLFLTVGIAAQISGLLLGLIRQSREEIRPGRLIESSGHIVAIGIYIVILVPLWVIQGPFLLLGWLWEAILSRLLDSQENDSFGALDRGLEADSQTKGGET